MALGYHTVQRVRPLPPPIPEPAAGFAATYYVDPSGTTGVTGVASDAYGEAVARDNIAAPWRTLAKAAQLAVPDSLVYVRGPWTAPTMVHSTARQGWVTFRPYPPEAAGIKFGILQPTGQNFAIFDGFIHTRNVQFLRACQDSKIRNASWDWSSPPSGNKNCVMIQGSNAAGDHAKRIDIENCDLDCGGFTGTPIFLGFSAIDGGARMEDINIRRCKCHNWRSLDGLEIRQVHNLLVEDVEFYDVNKVAGAHCDVIKYEFSQSGTHTFRNIHIHNENFPTGINDCFTMLLGNNQSTAFGATLDKAIFENCLVHDIGTAGGMNWGGTPLNRTTKLVLRNNTIPNKSWDLGGQTSSLVDEIWAFNNISGPINVHNTEAAPHEDANLVTALRSTASGYLGYPTGPNTVVGSPTFNSPLSPDFDYRLDNLSLGRNGGITTLNGESAPTTDRLGVARTAPYDMGCHEGGF